MSDVLSGAFTESLTSFSDVLFRGGYPQTHKHRDFGVSTPCANPLNVESRLYLCVAIIRDRQIDNRGLTAICEDSDGC